MPVSYIDFVEERLEIGVDYGVVGGPSFKTEILLTGSGKEQRNAKMWQPLGRWQLGDRMLLDSSIEGINKVLYLKNFHVARKGSKQGFRFKDWCDYRGFDQPLGTTDGITTQWQLKKIYRVSSEFTFRPILKPVQGTVKLYLDGVEITYPQINYSNGLISFAVPPTAGQSLTADFEFDVPVKFEADKVEWTLKAMQLGTGEFLHKLGSVFVKEMRINPDIEWYRREPIPQLISEPLDLGFILDVNETVTFSTREEKLDSGFARDESNEDIVKTLIKLPAKNFDQQELDKILAYFWIAKGRLVNLTLILNNKTHTARFDSDTLSIKFLAREDEDSLYEVNLVYLGILEQIIQGEILGTVLDLPGNNFDDLSLANHTVIPDGVYIQNGSFRFDGNSKITIPDNETWDFKSYDFTISLSLKLDRLSTAWLIGQNGLNPQNDISQSFYLIVRSSNDFGFIYKQVNGNTDFRVYPLPDNDYVTSFQEFKIKKENQVLNYFYKNSLLGQHNVTNFGSPFANVEGSLGIGFFPNPNSPKLLGNIKNIKIIKG